MQSPPIDIGILRDNPLFSTFDDQMLQELYEQAKVISIEKKAVIVKEHDVIDAVYLISTGKAEVSVATKHFGIHKETPLAVLYPGDTIGLNEQGFFSRTHLRTATVTALSDMVLLKIDLQTLHAFLEKYASNIEMLAQSDDYLKILLIKKSLPFSQLSKEGLAWLAKHIQEVSIKAQEHIFEEGEIGDSCYLIRQGVVEILSDQRVIASLKPPMLFGETTLISHAPRNATAIAKTDCKLLVLKHEYLSKILKEEQDVAKTFMDLTVDRSRPARQENISEHFVKSTDQNNFMILKNVTNDSYFKLSEEGAFIWAHLDGHHTLKDLTLLLSDRFQSFAPDMVAGLIAKLTSGGFIKNIQMEELQHVETASGFSKIWLRLRKVLEVRFAFGDANPLLTRTYENYLRPFFSLPVQCALLMVSIIGFIVFCLDTTTILFFFREKHASLFLLLTLIPFSLIATLLHEFAHAITVKAFGRDVHYLGIGWYFLVPIAFTDTSDMWLSNRRARMMVNLAGIYMDVLLGSVCAALILLFQHYPYIQCMFWLFAFYSYIHAIRMLSPFQEMDGYYLLLDYLDEPKLKSIAVKWLVHELPKTMAAPARIAKSDRHQNVAIIFWIAGLSFLVIMTLLTFLIEFFAFAIFGLTNPNPFLSSLLPMLVIFFSCLSIFAEIRRAR